MTTFTNIALALVCLVGVAGADDKAAKPTVARPEPPKPHADLAAMAKTVIGAWKCKGDSFEMPGGAKTPVTATNKVTVELDKFWIVDNLEVKGGMPFKMIAYTTYDSGAKKWRRVAVTNMGGYMVGTSDGMKDNKMDWNLDTVGPMSGQFREHVDAGDARAGVKFWGEMSADKGKTWFRVYEMACTK